MPSLFSVYKYKRVGVNRVICLRKIKMLLFAKVHFAMVEITANGSLQRLEKIDLFLFLNFFGLIKGVQLIVLIAIDGNR